MPPLLCTVPSGALLFAFLNFPAMNAYLSQANSKNEKAKKKSDRKSRPPEDSGAGDFHNFSLPVFFVYRSSSSSLTGRTVTIILLIQRSATDNTRIFMRSVLSSKVEPSSGNVPIIPQT